MRPLIEAQKLTKRDRNDARGIAQMMRVGLFEPVPTQNRARSRSEVT